MKIGLDSYSFHIALAAGGYDIFRTLDWMADLGLCGLQININGPDGRFLGRDPGDASQVRRVRAALEAKDFFSEIGGRRTSPEMLRWQLQLCSDLGADVLRTLLVLKDDLVSTIDSTRMDLETVLPFAESLGVKIALENHEDVTAEELRQLLDLVPHPYLGACIDTGNDLVVYGDPLEAARQLASRAVTTHIKDQRLVRVGDTIHSVGVRLGTGNIDLPAILSVIRDESQLDRILIQNCTGYSAPLNRFKRDDLHPTSDYADVPGYADEAECRAAGLHLNLDGLAPEALTALARRQEENICRDLDFVRSQMARYQ